MKFSTAIALALAPLSMARTVRKEVVRREILEGRAAALAHGMKGHGITVESTTNIIIIWANPGGGAKTTAINEQVTVITGGTPTHAPGAPPPEAGKEAPSKTTPIAAATHTVKVGGPGGLTYQPDQLQNVPVGDVVVFEFLSQNHTITQSPFDKPCDAISGGMDSGFIANPNNTVVPAPQVAMQVMTDKPLWFYCKQGNHCGAGMVFSINPTAEKTQAQFQALAIAQKGKGKATPITGGEPLPPPAEGGAAAPPATPSAAPPAAAPPAAPPAGAPSGATPGQGVVEGGACKCFVQCSAGGFPSPNQGIGSVGGFGGAIPLADMKL